MSALLKKIRQSWVRPVPIFGAFILGIALVISCGGGGSIVAAVTNAIDIIFDNATSGLTSVTVQDAIDELAAAEYADANAVSAMGEKANTNALNHDRYTDAEAVTAIKAADGSGSTLDADTLDGSDSTAFAGKGANTFTGAQTATNFTVSTTKTGYFTIPGVAFVSGGNVNDDATGDWSTDGTAFTRVSNTSTAQDFYAPVHLPQGAVVTGFTAEVYDNNLSKNITVALERVLFDWVASPTVNTIATAVSSGQPEYGAITGTPDTDFDDIDNNTYVYWVKASVGTSASITLAIGAVRITYTYTTF